VRAAAQLLHRPATVGSPAEVARWICGAQAQDMPAGRLAFRARSRRLRAVDIAQARTEKRSLLRAWVMRGTVHLIATEDADLLLPLFAPGMIARSRRRLEQLGLDRDGQDKATGLIENELASEGPRTRPEILEKLRGAGLVPRDEVKYHIWALATAQGIACLGPDRGGQTCLVLVRDWLGELSPNDRHASLAELARRYLRAFGPATADDLARWSGLGLREARAGVAAIATELEEVRIGAERAAMLKGAATRVARQGIVRLLPAFDTYLLGHRDRRFIVDPADWPRIGPGGGIIHPTVIVDGVAVATWRARRDRAKLRIELHPFEKLDKPTTKAIEAEVADIGRFEEREAKLVAG
jgi:DNA glycosylase AlkZ-like